MVTAENLIPVNSIDRQYGLTGMRKETSYRSIKKGNCQLCSVAFFILNMADSRHNHDEFILSQYRAKLQRMNSSNFRCSRAVTLVDKRLHCFIAIALAY
mgnify:CR=1 FL=1